MIVTSLHEWGNEIEHEVGSTDYGQNHGLVETTEVNKLPELCLSHGTIWHCRTSRCPRDRWHQPSGRPQYPSPMPPPVPVHPTSMSTGLSRGQGPKMIPTVSNIRFPQGPPRTTLITVSHGRRGRRGQVRKQPGSDVEVDIVKSSVERHSKIREIIN
ncbi:hypothetical protein BX600DRAFT_458063 [Xylariales sp. PMI_506]|nr:hypothetical protein BX600DRAFT_458063 [Xylariales sp. PMI_506]